MLPMRFLAVPPLLAAALALCAPPSAAQGNGGGQTTSAGPAFTQADVSFVRGMIMHHGQALEMTDLVFARTGRQDVRLLSERIALSQRDEIHIMRQWLGARGQDTAGVPVDTMTSMSGKQMGQMAHDSAMQMPLMPGMLTPEEMRELAASSGAQFDRLFLQFMIRHHQGALKMVADLFATPGAGQEPEIFRMASDVDADQRAEIARMQAMLAAAPAAAHHR